jgi:hypothetical protein
MSWESLSAPLENCSMHTGDSLPECAVGQLIPLASQRGWCGIDCRVDSFREDRRSADHTVSSVGAVGVLLVG